MTDRISALPTRFLAGALSLRRPTRFDYAPDRAASVELARSLGLLGLYQLRFHGEIAPDGRGEFLLTGSLSADVSQACVVTLDPVDSRVRETVTRRFVTDLPEPAADEVEMAPDDTIEPLPEMIDIAEIAIEALMLALPLYPRAPGATLGEMIHAEAGVTPLADGDLKPFAGLAALAGRLVAKPDGESGDNG